MRLGGIRARRAREPIEGARDGRNKDFRDRGSLNMVAELPAWVIWRRLGPDITKTAQEKESESRLEE